MAPNVHDRLRELGQRLGPRLQDIAARLAAQVEVGESALHEWMTGLLGGPPDGLAVAQLPQVSVLRVIATLRGELDDRIAERLQARSRLALAGCEPALRSHAGRRNSRGSRGLPRS